MLSNISDRIHYHNDQIRKIEKMVERLIEIDERFI